jgi:uncharacterized repeat protein (TIGR03803 family)
MQWPTCLRFVLSTLFLFAMAAMPIQSVHAQTYKVLYNFTGGQDGGVPQAGVTIDRGGNLYGTTSGGFVNGGSQAGAVFKLTHTGVDWILTPLYNFQGGSDGAGPEARVIFGPDGSLYGTVVYGGVTNGNCIAGCGTVFNLRPSATSCKTALCGWNVTVLYQFMGGTDGSQPGFGDLVFDQAGDIYGTTQQGGSTSQCLFLPETVGCGVVYELRPVHGSWTESVLYAFSGGSDGAEPYGGVIFDSAGNLLGSTFFGGTDLYGTVFQLTPSGGRWTETSLYEFAGASGDSPRGGVIRDGSGNLYGTTSADGPNGGGTVFELTAGSRIFSLLYGFTGLGTWGPAGSLAFDRAGNLYGTTLISGLDNDGSVFKLTPAGNGNWSHTSLHDFTGGSDGGRPYGNVSFDANGNLYGTASQGGVYGYGVVWEIMP